jgi:hypothetical protein
VLALGHAVNSNVKQFFRIFDIYFTFFENNLITEEWLKVSG